MDSRNWVAANATIHCLTGCAIGEIAGLMIGTAAGWSNVATIALAVGLAFLFGYLLSTVPLVQTGMAFATALKLVFAADTLSIAVMEIVDNAVMAAIPGAMEAGLAAPIFWLGMIIALTVAFFAAFPVNRALIARGKGHALHHQAHGGGHAPAAAGPHAGHHGHHEHAGHERHGGHQHGPESGSHGQGPERPRRQLNTNLITAAVIGFLLGGLAATASTSADDEQPAHGAGVHDSQR